MSSLIHDVANETMRKFSAQKKAEVTKLSNDIISGLNYQNKSSLLIGRVQSGKTTTFINVIASALEGDFQNVIVLTGTKNDLNNQTFKRINETFKMEKTYDSFHESFRINVCDIDSPPSKEELLNKNFKNIIVSKKGATTSKIVKLCGYGKTLIIDDESDHASNDTNGANGKKPRSTTNNFLTDIFKIEEVFYLAVTATPQSHSLMNEGEFNRPANIFFVNAGDGYKGINAFFEETSPIIRIVPENEAETIKTDNKWTTDSEIKAIKMALVEYVIKVWALKQKLIIGEGVQEKDQKFENFNMMINIDLENFKQEQVGMFASDFVKKLLNKNDDTLERYIANNKFVFELLEELNIHDNAIDIAKKIQEMRSDSIRIVYLNKDSDDKNISNITSNIIIGGHSLSRGLTINNLIISYFIQDPKEVVASTTLQRARWFGYRERYFKYTRLYITRNILRVFKELMDVENILWKYSEMNEKHSVQGLNCVFAHYDSVKVVPKNIAKYARISKGFSKYDSNFGDGANETHDEAFKWFDETLKEKMSKVATSHGVGICELSIQSILETLNPSDENSVLESIKLNLISLSSKSKKIRVISFFNADENRHYRGSKKGWKTSQKYSPSGRNGAGKLNDLDYSLTKSEDEYMVPDIQFHPIWDKDTGARKLFFAVFKENATPSIANLNSKK